MKATVLVVDDEAVVQRLLGEALIRAGYNVELVSTGAAAIDRLAHPGVDLLLLDLQLGDMDGIQVMEVVHQRWPFIPIIMLTAHGSLSSAIAAVRCDVADYLLKPVSVETLRERVRCVLDESQTMRRRDEQLQDMYQRMQSFLQGQGVLADPSAGSVAQASSLRSIKVGPLMIDPQQHTVRMHNQPVDVTPSEFAILFELARIPGAVVSCMQLMRASGKVVDDEEEARLLIRPHIVRLRRKLEPDTRQPHFLVSVRGVGYRWLADEL
jgi:DNA-binding response OmpR family regulator